MQGAQSESRFRGIGRYSLSFAQAVARNRGEHEVLIVLNGLLSDSVGPIRAAFRELIPSRNVLVWHAPGPVSEHYPGNEFRTATAKVIREWFLAALRPDVVHVTSVFEGFVDDTVVSVGSFGDVCPTTATSYDFIPLQNPGQYFSENASYERFYRQQLEHLKRTHGIFAISQSSAREAAEALGLPADRIVCTYGGVGDAFIAATSKPREHTRLIERWGILSDFVLYVGGVDGRKNVPRLIEAYAGLPQPLRRSHQLVLAGRMSDGELHYLRQLASSAGLVHDELVFTGYVSDEDLARLYRACKLFVFPPWHEGFGLPALEAMACGAPVIAAKATSIPEVVGLDEALFDPLSVASICDLMTKALRDEEFRKRLIENAEKRRALFSWDDAALRAIKAWESIQGRSAPGVAQQRTEIWAEAYRGYRDLYAQFVRVLGEQVCQHNRTSPFEVKRLAGSLADNEHTLFDYWRHGTLPERLKWRIEGPFDSSYSLALVNREMARGLAALGHDVSMHSTEGPGDFEPDPRFLEANPDLAILHHRSTEVSQPDCDVVSRNLYPPRVGDMQSSMKMLHAYGWEESGFPQGWVARFNDSLQGITTMSSHVRKLLIDNGVAVSMEVSGLGVDHWERIAADAAFAVPVPAKTFRFLHVSSCFPRKGVDAMLAAYGRAFAANDAVTLIVKTFPNPHNEISRLLDAARAANDQYPDVQIIEDDLTDPQLKALYSECDALVAPSRAEGFGLPLAEAMLSGLPVITTAWSGQMDFCSDETAWLVDYSFTPAKTHFELFDSVWAEPDVEDLTRQMREVYEAPLEERKTRAAAGRQLLLKRFTWRESAKRQVAAVRRWAAAETAREPSIGWVTTWNTRCGIAAYSQHLIAGMRSDVRIFAPHSNPAELAGVDEGNVERCWAAGDQDDLSQLRVAVESAGIDTLVMQFNYAFYGFEELNSFITRVSESGCDVVVMMHATVDPAHRPDLRVYDLAPGLSQCRRVLVHTPADMNRLKDVGLTNNVALFPHGIVDFQPKTDMIRRHNDAFVVASYGFFLPHKGLLELVEAIELIRRQGINVRLEMLNAEYPAPESKNLIEIVRRTIDELGLAESVSLTTDYLPVEECLDRLSVVDLVVFPYQHTGESSSAAVRYGIASGAPVAVTPLSIFDDVKPAVSELPGVGAKDLARGLIDLVTKHQAMRTVSEGDASGSWRESHRYSLLGERLYNMLVALHSDRQT